jgi:3-keto-disaccharide hydrolase
MSEKTLCRTSATVAFALLGITSSVAGQDDPFAKQKPPPVVGRWDITVHGPDGDYPSWLEVRQSGYRTLVGSFVGRVGSARPISLIGYENGRIHFSVPPQWERRTDLQQIEGRLEGEVLRGETTDDEGRQVAWEAHRAPSLKRAGEPHWGEAIELFNGRDLSGWKPRNAGAKNGWLVRDGVLVNAEPGNDLLTERKLTDFKLHVEFRYPRGSNSGIYLRGRYEVQIEDNYGKEPDSHHIGGIYGFLMPIENAAKKSGEWQTLELTLVGRAVTVVLNGEEVIDRQAIPGITGGALDSDEGAPGPIMLQGDHGVVEFQKVTLIPGMTSR